MIPRLGGIITKSRNIADVWSATTPPTVLLHNGAVYQTYATTAPIKVRYGSEKIVYTNSVKGGYPDSSNRCNHFKTETFFNGGVNFAPIRSSDLRPGFTGYEYVAYWGYPTSESSHGAILPIAKSQLDYSGQTPNWPLAQSWINDGFRRLQPDLTEVSVPNFLYELTDITKMYENLRDLKRYVQTTRPSRNPLASNVANAHLAVSFGWLPTIGDVSGMVSAVWNFRQKIKDFEKLVGTTIRRSLRVLDTSTTKSGVYLLNGNNSLQVKWNGTLKRTIRTHFVYRPQPILAISEMDKTLRGLMDSLGFEFNPRIIWDEIPFSFVVDWFFGVGKWLSNFKIDALELPILCTDSCVTIKDELRVESYLVENPFGYPTNSTSMETYPAWVTTEMSFQRIPLLPNFDVFQGLGWKMPSGKQTALLASLVTQALKLKKARV